MERLIPIFARTGPQVTGTFHPDEASNTEVILRAAVDPALYPLIEVTAEPSGGNPAVEGAVVAFLDSSGTID